MIPFRISPIRLDSAMADDWKKKYFDSLDSLDKEREKFKAMEGTLKRFVGRLCTASLGQSPELDEQIKKLQTAIRREASNEELDKITPTLTDAIGALDQAPKKSAPTEQSSPMSARSDPTPKIEERPFDDERVRSVLAALIVELRRDSELLIKVDALDATLATPLTKEKLPEVLSTLSELVGQRIQRIERAKQEVEVLLGHMVGKLDEIGQFVAEQNHNQTQAQASSETLNVQLVGEVKAMGESMDAAGDLQQIRSQVRSRLDSIGRHLKEFREREATRADAMKKRNEQMRARVAELEAEATRLHGQLKDEQRLATMDVLTKIPNRLAYENRIAEELKRYQRFKQPTCIAVWDVDHFKKINDAYGHRAGDRVLRAVAESLTGRIRGTDFLARYGGEEFVMILVGTKLDDGLKLLNEMRVDVEKLALNYRGTPFTVTVSSGITLLQASDTAAAAFDRADKAMYQAKNRGRNQCVSL